MKKMTAELLLEIGTEEIPAGYLENGLNELKRLAEECLTENRIEWTGGLEVYGTPRRLVLMGENVSKKAEGLDPGGDRSALGKWPTTRKGGPPKRPQGLPEKQGVSVARNCKPSKLPKGNISM
jgi:glycyl-tRNA synthetase beta chain